ncbi:uncharacterized protein LTR77_009855 [Saxophila tyrrhenica]|uniref:Uncharacterized protein n=1 Tax=Saxophila tyrrhenica TaxID=1690608 RepID=A0AAV9NXN1_9PEZI|nr:hypothetical protein LTR77_009855 [Saxophila tyrrhenica]
MPSGLQKTTRSKTKRTNVKSGKPESSTTSSSTRSACQHQYLDSGEQTAIESWNNTVPQKAMKANEMPDERDPVIQAYLEAKLSLFQKAAVNNGAYRRSQSASTVGSGKS